MTRSAPPLPPMVLVFVYPWRKNRAGPPLLLLQQLLLVRLQPLVLVERLMGGWLDLLLLRLGLEECALLLPQELQLLLLRRPLLRLLRRPLRLRRAEPALRTDHRHDTAVAAIAVHSTAGVQPVVHVVQHA